MSNHQRPPINPVPFHYHPKLEGENSNGNAGVKMLEISTGSLEKKNFSKSNFSLIEKGKNQIKLQNQ